MFVPNKRQNGWTDRAHDPREGLWNIKIEEEKMDFILKMQSGNVCLILFKMDDYA